SGTAASKIALASITCGASGLKMADPAGRVCSWPTCLAHCSSVRWNRRSRSSGDTTAGVLRIGSDMGGLSPLGGGLSARRAVTIIGPMSIILGMKLCISTLACPTWTLDQIIAGCAQAGVQGIDFRGIGDELDITRLPEFNRRLDETLARFR